MLTKILNHLQDQSLFVPTLIQLTLMMFPCQLTLLNFLFLFSFSWESFNMWLRPDRCCVHVWIDDDAAKITMDCRNFG